MYACLCRFSAREVLSVFDDHSFRFSLNVFSQGFYRGGMRKSQFMSQIVLRIQLTISRLATRSSLSQDIIIADRGCNQMSTYNNWYSYADQQPKLQLLRSEASRYALPSFQQCWIWLASVG